MCQAIARHLKPGGRFISVNNNPDYTGATESMRKYGFTREATAVLAGTPIGYQFFLDDGTSFEITNYYLSIPTHEETFAMSGLHGLRWHPARVAPAGLAQFGSDFWADFLQLQPVIFLECKKGS
jgi:hypothetical protein